MKREMTCIICPKGCLMQVEQQGDTLKVTGNTCPKGAAYANDECLHPTRTVTSVVRVNNRKNTMVSVKTQQPIAKERIFDLMTALRTMAVSAPVGVGDVLGEPLPGARIIATVQVD